MVYMNNLIASFNACRERIREFKNIFMCRLMLNSIQKSTILD